MPRACMAAYINTTEIAVNGLAEYTTYFFQMYAGDSLGLDTVFYTPAPQATTLLNRTVEAVRARWTAPGWTHDQVEHADAHTIDSTGV